MNKVINKARIYTVIAEELGVELGEEFNLIFQNGTKAFFGPYKLTKNGVFDSGNNEIRVNGIIDGSAKIEKIPWAPKYKEGYYFPDFRCATSWGFDCWTGETFDINIKKRVGVYKTKEEAIAKAKELGWTK